MPKASLPWWQTVVDKHYGPAGVSSVVEHLPSMLKVQGSTPSTAKQAKTGKSPVQPGMVWEKTLVYASIGECCTG